jgi:hypothetical protein
MGRFSFVAKIVAGLLNTKKASVATVTEAPNKGSHFSTLAAPKMVWGSHGFNYEEIRQARRKTYRGKTFRTFRGSSSLKRAHA